MKRTLKKTPKKTPKSKKETIILNGFCGPQQGIYTPQNILLIGLLLLERR